MRIGHGYDVHKFCDNRKLIIGGVDIPYEKGLLGHSDADVLLHAVSDALLGAAALGDIGKHFPDNAKEFLINVLSSMNIDAEIRINEENDVIKIDLSGPKMGLVIGYRGETLDSLQYLVSLVINKNHNNSYKRVVLDAENYRKKREETLIRVAQKSAYKVRKSQRPYKLEPMNPYERRIIHSALQEYTDINTHSEGEEPFRRIVISLKK